MSTLDRLDQLFVRKDTSNPASTRDSYSSLHVGKGDKRRGSSAKARVRDSIATPLKVVKKDASTQLYTVRQGYLSKHVFQSVKHQYSSKELAKQVGVLGSRVAALAADLLKVLALWITGNSTALEPPGASRSSSPGSATAECLTALEADDLLDVPPSIVHILHPETAEALFAYLPSALRTAFTTPASPSSQSHPLASHSSEDTAAAAGSPTAATAGPSSPLPPRHHHQTVSHSQAGKQTQVQGSRNSPILQRQSSQSHHNHPLHRRRPHGTNANAENNGGEMRPEESLARVLTAWGATRAKKGRVYSSPILRRGWVCRICRRDASRMYAYDKTNRRLDHVDDEHHFMEKKTGHGTFRQKRRVSTLYRPHPPAPSSSTTTTMTTATPAGGRLGSATNSMQRGSSRGVSPQRQLCGVGFSQTLRATSPEEVSTLFNGSFFSRTTGFAGEDHQAVLNGRNALLHRSRGKG